MSNLVLGRNVIIYARISGIYYPIFCGKTAEFNVRTDKIETTTTSSPGSREYLPGLTDASLTVTGILTSDQSNSRISYFWMLQEQLQGNIQDILITCTDQSSVAKNIQFSAMIEGSGLAKPDVNSWGQSSVTFAVSGDIVVDPSSSPSNTTFTLLSDYWNTSNGNAFINGSSVEWGYTLTNSTDTILAVFVERLNYNIVSGAPGNGEAQPDLVNNKIKFENAFDGTQTVFVVFKRTI